MKDFGMILGYLLNFGEALMKNGISRDVNGLEKTKQEVFALSASWRENNFGDQTISLLILILISIISYNFIFYLAIRMK